jgi:hypothetical protein
VDSGAGDGSRRRASPREVTLADRGRFRSMHPGAAGRESGARGLQAFLRDEAPRHACHH